MGKSLLVHAGGGDDRPGSASKQGVQRCLALQLTSVNATSRQGGLLCMCVVKAQQYIIMCTYNWSYHVTSMIKVDMVCRWSKPHRFGTKCSFAWAKCFRWALLHEVADDTRLLHHACQVGLGGQTDCICNKRQPQLLLGIPNQE